MGDAVVEAVDPYIRNRAPRSDEDLSRRIFCGALSWLTTDDDLQEYFKAYGNVNSVLVMKDRETGQSRGFGFVEFSDADSVNTVLKSGPHKVNDRIIDIKRSLQQSEAPPSIHKSSTPPVPKSKLGMPPPPPLPSVSFKIFVGNLSPLTSVSSLKSHFSQFGPCTATLQPSTNSSPPSAYVQFPSPHPSILNTLHIINDKEVAVSHVPTSVSSTSSTVLAKREYVPRV
ncbi:hypothetical protein TrST_g8438 [Triparma strigata]|uniref:RRM domain-containing protein n=1 Tax=Triparma strigata TaxID=1606541 RepID=A0A9W7AD85_9STRA|nr:hypothetical protein TrST_g8438 [Triparma strigata]